MRINEGILDDIEAREVNVRSMLPPSNELKWPGDSSLTTYITLEFSGYIKAAQLKILCDDLLLFLDIERKITDYSRMCPSDSQYRMIRDLDDAALNNKKFKNYGIDFAVSNKFTRAKDAIRFITKLSLLCGSKLYNMKVRAQYGKEYSVEVDKTYLNVVLKILGGKKNRSTYCEIAMRETLSIVNIFMPDNSSIASEIIDIFKSSFDLYRVKIRNIFYPFSQCYLGFDLESTDNYVTLPEDLKERMLSQRVSWNQFASFGDGRSNIDDLIFVNNAGAEINANRIEAAKVLDETPVKIHDVVFRHNKVRNIIFMCVVLDPFLIDTHNYRPNFQLAYFSYVLSEYEYDKGYKMLSILFPWMKKNDYETIWSSARGR